MGVRAAVQCSLWKKCFQSFCWKGCFSKAAAGCLMMYSRHSLVAWPITLLHLLLSAHFTWVDCDKSNKALRSSFLQKAQRCFPCLLSCATAEPSRAKLLDLLRASSPGCLFAFIPFLPAAISLYDQATPAWEVPGYRSEFQHSAWDLSSITRLRGWY